MSNWVATIKFQGLLIDAHDTTSWCNLNVCLRQLNRMDEAIFLSKLHISNCIMKSRLEAILHQRICDESGN